MTEIEELKEQVRLLEGRIAQLEVSLKNHEHQELAPKGHTHPRQIPLSERRF